VAHSCVGTDRIGARRALAAARAGCRACAAAALSFGLRSRTRSIPEMGNTWRRAICCWSCRSLVGSETAIQLDWDENGHFRVNP
jgi:hypothetical protein